MQPAEPQPEEPKDSREPDMEVTAKPWELPHLLLTLRQKTREIDRLQKFFLSLGQDLYP